MSLGDQVASSGNALTGIVVVFFRPDAACVRRANRYADAGLCVVVDNTEQLQTAEQLGLDKRIVYVANAANLGIATGINQGVDRLLKAGCASALIFDQDSEPSRQLLEVLPRLLDEERHQRGQVALIGPAYEDARLGGVAPFVRFGYLKLRRIAPVGTQGRCRTRCARLASCARTGRRTDPCFRATVSESQPVASLLSLSECSCLNQMKLYSMDLEVHGTRQVSISAGYLWIVPAAASQSSENGAGRDLAWPDRPHGPAGSIMTRCELQCDSASSLMRKFKSPNVQSGTF